LPFAVQSIMLYVFGVGMNFFAFFTSQLFKISDEKIGKINAPYSFKLMH
jgi:uncharacterized membrane protein YidH (DUF202 family)